LGDNDFTGRLGAVLAGIAITILPLFMQKWLGKLGVLAATLLMAVSPVMMHRSRYFRHDQFNLLFNLILFIVMLRYLDQRKNRDLYIAAAALGLGFATKETTFITYFIFGTFLFGLWLWQWWKDRRRPLRELPVFDLLVVLGTLILPFASPLAIQVLGYNPVDYSSKGVLASGSVLLLVVAISTAIGVWWDWRRWVVCAGVYYFVVIFFFTTMFTNGQGVATGVVGSLGYWLSQHGVQRGGQPMHYYVVLMGLYEFLPEFLGIGGTIAYLARWVARKPIPEAKAAVDKRPLPVVLFLIYWTWAAFVAYTISGEKMPWLCMQLTVPLHLLGGWALGKLLEAQWATIRAKGGLWLLLFVPLLVYALIALLGGKLSSGTSTQELSQSLSWFFSLFVLALLLVPVVKIVRGLGASAALRMAALAILVVLLGVTIRFAWMVTYIYPDMVNEFLVYAQGAPDTRLVTRELEDMSRRMSGDLSLKVAYDDDSSWPFVWYLRNFTNAQFYGKKPGGPFDTPVVIVGPANEAGVKPLLGNRYYRRQYRLVWWPNQDWYMDLSPAKLWNTFRDPVARQKFIDVVWDRKHEAALTAWPYVHNFALYVRRDFAQQLWSYGPEIIAQAGQLPGDDYAEKWKAVPGVATYGSAGGAAGQLRSPKGVGLDAQGNLYVADTFNHRIQVLDPQGRPLRQWGSEGTQPGQFKEPWAVAVAANGDVYVTDTWNHRIQVFDNQGVFKRAWGTFGEAKQPQELGNLLYGPRDVALDAEGNVYVSDTGNKRIVKYDAEGKMLAAVGGQGNEDGQFQEPVGIAIAKDGTLYVADTWNQRVQAFDKQLSFLRQWPVLAWEGLSVVNKPYLAVDEAGQNVYVTDPEQFRVIKFSNTGKLVAVWGQSGADLSSLNLPTGIRVDKAGRVLVADSENHRIVVYIGN
jgi:uncharacterized protein (TIGR03663 family)